MTHHSFDRFLAEHPIYRRSYEQLVTADPLLARSARTVVEINGREVGAVAEPILTWAALRYGSDFLDRYLERLATLNRLQERFQAAPSLATLGDPTAKVHRDSYDLALLLSLIYSNHRFGVLQALKEFLQFVVKPRGRLAAIGIGTGYELHVITAVLPQWVVAGYDLDEAAGRNAVHLLSHFSPAARFELGQEFPLDRVVAGFRRSFDAIVMCELLEHLPNPLGALQTVREYLAPEGHLFMTMAINIAQEDHVFLYPSVSACRQQLRQANLSVVHEWLNQVIVHPSTLRRRSEISYGNYAAIART